MISDTDKQAVTADLLAARAADLDSMIEREVGEATPKPLFRQRDPRWMATKEQPWHRQVAYHKLAGLTSKEIAGLVGKTEVAIHNALRLPWVADLIASEADRIGRDQVQMFLENQVVPSLEKLAELRDECENPEVQRKAANDLLNRGPLGMPTQKVEHTKGKNLETLSDEELMEIVNQRKN